MERSLGVQLPADYKALIATYGSGVFGDVVTVLNPFSRRPFLSLMVTGRQILDATRSRSDEIPYPVFPAAGGILPWATTQDGDRLFWRTVGEPDRWSVIQAERQGDRWRKSDLSCTAFLTRWLSGGRGAIILRPAAETFEPAVDRAVERSFFAFMSSSFGARLSALLSLFPGAEVRRKASEHSEGKGYAQCVFVADPARTVYTYDDNAAFGSILSAACVPRAREQVRRVFRRVSTSLGWRTTTMKALEQMARRASKMSTGRRRQEG